MSVWLDAKTRIIVQGATGRQGSFHLQRMLEYGAKVVAGVTPGKGGQEVHGVPVFNSVAEAPDADLSVVFVPAQHARSACEEAHAAGLRIVLITEHVPVHDVLSLLDQGAKIIGPNCPGLLSPGKSKAGIIPTQIASPGGIGIVSRSGTLTYEVMQQLTLAGLGQSTVVGIGGDPVVGTDYVQALEAFAQDNDTKAVVLIGEIGGQLEERAAEYLRTYDKPVVSYIAGRTAPPDRIMGHAGAIVRGSHGTAKSKIAALRAAKVPVASLPSGIPEMLKELI